MLRLSGRCGGHCVLLAIAAALYVAAPAMAINPPITTTHVTTPGGLTFLQYDHDASVPQTFDIAGTSDGTTGDHVDIVCPDVDSVAVTNVPVNANGSFSAPDVAVSSCPTFLVRLRAIPVGQADDGEHFTGPVIGFGAKQLSYNGEQRYDYDIKSATAGDYSEYNSASGRGFFDSYLFDPDLNSRHGLWAGVAQLNSVNRDGDQGLSEITVDGHDAYTPGGAYYTNSLAVAPSMTVTDEMDPATGELVIHETDPLVYCGDGSGNIADPVAGGPPVCPEFLPAPVTLQRTITESRDGRQSTISDDYSSTDGASHALGTWYDNLFNADYMRFPGDGAYTEHADGAQPSLGASGPGAILVEQDPNAPDGPDNLQAAIAFLTHPDRATFVRGTSDSQYLQLQYARTIPSSGPVNVSQAYIQGFDRDVVTADSAAAVDGAQSPSVTITSPAGNAAVTEDWITVTGTATDNGGVTSLTVNGSLTAISPGGTWSQTITRLAKGTNTITATARDATGNSSSASQTVVYSPPAASSDPPPAAAVVVVAGSPAPPAVPGAPAAATPATTAAALAVAQQEGRALLDPANIVVTRSFGLSDRILVLISRKATSNTVAVGSGTITFSQRALQTGLAQNLFALAAETDQQVTIRQSLRFATGTRAVKLATQQMKIASGHARTVKLHLTTAARHAVNTGHRVRLTVTITTRDSLGRRVSKNVTYSIRSPTHP